VLRALDSAAVKVLITGAAGLVGSHFARRLAREHDVTALDHGNLDITDLDAVERRVTDTKPDVIVNCAVLQVDDSEKDPVKAEAVNVDGPGYLAEAASKVGAEIIHFSTQYAFEGEPLRRAPYTMSDAPAPVNVYGKTKVIGEEAVHKACARSYLIRTSWVYGSGKNSFLCAVRDDLKSGKKVRAIDDIWSSTTYVEDLIDRVMLIRRNGFFGTFHVVNAGICTYYEFALEAGRLVGLARSEIDRLIEITHERDMKRIAARPRYTPMRCLLSEQLGLPPMRDWHAALAAYVGEKME
jgi:dTDP-4-dehydrorhamnose reductase